MAVWQIKFQTRKWWIRRQSEPVLRSFYCAWGDCTNPQWSLTQIRIWENIQTGRMTAAWVLYFIHLVCNTNTTEWSRSRVSLTRDSLQKKKTIYTYLSIYLSIFIYIDRHRYRDIYIYISLSLYIYYIYIFHKYPKLFRCFVITKYRFLFLFNLGSYNKPNHKTPNQRNYGTRLTSSNLFKQQITSSSSFVRSRLENKTSPLKRENWQNCSVLLLRW